MTLAITIACVAIFFAVMTKAIYHDVFGHWPTFKEIWDYHQVDKDLES